MALREARNLAALEDERIVRVHDVVESADFLALVMEYVPGIDLERVLRGVPLSVASILSISTDLAAALAAARRAGMVHGDLKAGNVLVTEQGRVKLSDFGIASAILASGETRGSVAAIAPEQVTGDPVDVRTDLFALGRLMYRMLTGEHAYAIAGQPSMHALSHQEPPQVSVAIPPEREVPPELCTLVQALLQKDPDKRPSNTHQVRRSLRQLSRMEATTHGGDLLRQARPLFRDEVPGEVPLAIPRQLSRAARSRRALAARKRRWLSWLPQSRSGRAMLAAVAGLSVLTLGLLLRSQPLVVHIQEPVLAVDTGTLLARDVDAAFLAAEASANLRQWRDDIYLRGAVAPRTIVTGHAAHDGVADSEQLAIQVRCSTAFCLLQLDRVGQGVRSSYQQLLLSDASALAWREGMQQGLAGLYQ